MKLETTARRHSSMASSSHSGHEYRPDFLPLTLSEVERNGEVTLQKTVGLVNGGCTRPSFQLGRQRLTRRTETLIGIALVVGMQVGSGIL